MIDHYATLQIPRDAGTDSIVRAWKLAAQVWHPDKPTGDAEKFRAAREAYDTLMNREARAKYDAKLLAPPTVSHENYSEASVSPYLGAFIDWSRFDCPLCGGAQRVRVQYESHWLIHNCPLCVGAGA